MKNETVESIKKLTDAKTMVFENLSVLSVTAGTNGIQGGDSSKGGRTIIEFANLSASDMRISMDGKEIDSWDKIAIIFGGDSELENIIGGLKFALTMLEKKVARISQKDIQTDNFTSYLNELVEHYRATGSLKGMTDIRNKYGVTGITKEEFFELDLHQISGIDRMSAEKIYNYVKGKKKKRK